MWTEIPEIPEPHFLLEEGNLGERSNPELLQGFKVALGSVLVSRVPREVGAPS